MLKLTKKGDKYWLFEDSEIGLFSPSKFTINLLKKQLLVLNIAAWQCSIKNKRVSKEEPVFYII